MKEFQIQQKIKNKNIIQLSNKSIKQYLYGVGFLFFVITFWIISQGAFAIRNNILLVFPLFLLLFILFNLIIYGGDARIAGDNLYVNKIIGKDFKVPISDVESSRSYVLGRTRLSNIKFHNGEFVDKVMILSSKNGLIDEDVNPEQIIKLAKSIYPK